MLCMPCYEGLDVPTCEVGREQLWLDAVANATNDSYGYRQESQLGLLGKKVQCLNH